MHFSTAASIKLPVNANSEVGVGLHGEVIIGGIDDDMLYSYQYHSDQYTQTWKKPCPSRIEADCRKYVSAGGDILIHDDSTTHRYSSSLQPLSQHQHQGDLIACLPDDALVYRQKDSAGVWSVHISGGTADVTLHAPPAHPWGQLISVCATGDRLTVVEYYTKSMNIFSRAGESLSDTCSTSHNVR